MVHQLLLEPGVHLKPMSREGVNHDKLSLMEDGREVKVACGCSIKYVLDADEETGGGGGGGGGPTGKHLVVSYSIEARKKSIKTI